MDQNLRRYIIRSESGNYYKGHYKNGWAFTSEPKEAFHFDTREEADTSASQMNEIIKYSNHYFSNQLEENDNLPFVSLVL